MPEEAAVPAAVAVPATVSEPPLPEQEPPRQVAATATAVSSIPELIEDKALKQGVDPKLVRRIAFCESSLRHKNEAGQIVRGKRNPYDLGLFQINELYHLEKSQKLGFDLYDLEGNIDYALWLIQNEGTRHWRSSRSCWS